MKERTIRIELTRRRFGAAAALLLLGAAARELGSQALNATASYPSPLGIYTRIITTGDARLARDGGSVLIGNVAVAAPNRLRLEVARGIHASGDICLGQPNDPTCLTDMLRSVRGADGILASQVVDNQGGTTYVLSADISGQTPFLQRRVKGGACTGGTAIFKIDANGNRVCR